MSVQLQARGKGLCPVNTNCTSDSLAGFLEREGYTDIKVVTVKEGVKKSARNNTKPEASRVERRPSADLPAPDRKKDTAPARRRVTRTPRVK